MLVSTLRENTGTIPIASCLQISFIYEAQNKKALTVMPAVIRLT